MTDQIDIQALAVEGLKDVAVLSNNGEHAPPAPPAMSKIAEITGLNDPRPVFDASNLSWPQGRKLAKVQGQRIAIARQMDAIQLTDFTKLTPDDAQKMSALLEKLIDDLEATNNEQEHFLCQVLVSVPRQWLVDNAPVDIDWHQREAFQWLRHDKFADLVQSFVPQNIAKNSEPR